MKLADAPADVRASLDRIRSRGPGTIPRHPADGELWFDEDCDVCGADPTTHGPLVQDHCHITGLHRGHLCRGCNVAEGIHRGDHWPFWRLHAPGFADRMMCAGERSPYLSTGEAMTLPMSTLFALHNKRKAVDVAWPLLEAIVADLYPEAAS